MATPEIERGIRDVLLRIPAVETVRVSRRGGMVAVCTVIDDEDEGVLDSIYDQERAIIRQFAALQFDFTVVARRGRPLDELMSFEKRE